MRNIKLRLLGAVLLILFICKFAYTSDDASVYSSGLSAAKTGNRDAAFMEFRFLLDRFPDSKYKEEALFAAGEYYFFINDYFDAKKAFLDIAANSTNDKIKTLALAYLYNIAKTTRNDSAAKSFGVKIALMQRQVFLFKESKGYSYVSALRLQHKVTYYIDRVDFLVDGVLFAQVAY